MILITGTGDRITNPDRETLARIIQSLPRETIPNPFPFLYNKAHFSSFAILLEG